MLCWGEPVHAGPAPFYDGKTSHGWAKSDMSHHHHHHSPGHDHGHPHGVFHPPDVFDRAFAWGIGLNVLFVVVEAVVGWRIGSLALLADAGHNLSDVFGLFMAWGARKVARWRPSPRYTYGWQRAGVLAAFLNGALLLLACGALAWEAWQRVWQPQPLQGGVMVLVATVGIAINAATAWLFMRGSRDDLNLRGAFLHMVADALVSAGVVLAGVLAWGMGWSWIDPVVSLVIMGVIVWGAWGLFFQSVHLLFDGVPPHLDWHEVRHSLQALPGVVRVVDLHIWATGTTQVALTAHLVVPTPGAGGDALLQQATQLLQGRFGIGHVTLQIASQATMEKPCDQHIAP